MRKLLPLFLVVTFLSGLLPHSSVTHASASAEDRCFDLLTQRAQNNPTFASLDLTKVRKLNGKNGTIKSEPFSVATYNDFINTFNRYIPRLASDIVHYPNEMNKVSSSYKFKRKVHKANRNNSASIIYNDGTKTNIDHTVQKGGVDYRQQIDGYYVDSKFVTFGRQSRLAFSFPARDPNPGNKNFFPTGRPVKDMREYIMYTHHLSPKYGGKFMGCSLVKMVPQGSFKLQDYNPGDKAITWDNYGGTRMSESNVRTQVVGGGDFRLGEVEYTINNSVDPTKRLLRFYVMNLSYDNKSSFMNPFITMDLFDKAMKDAHNTSKTFTEMRRAFYDRVIASGLTIGNSIAPDPSELPTYQDYGNMRDDPRTGMNIGGSWREFYRPDKPTADYICQQLGHDEGQWTGTPGRATAPGWSYWNLRIRFWNGSAQDDCVGGSQCISRGSQFGRNLRCATNPPPAPKPVPSAASAGAAEVPLLDGFSMGSSVICTHYNKKNLLSDELYATETEYGKTVDPRLYAGYLLWAKPFVAWLEKNEWADVVVAPLVNAWALEVSHQMGQRENGNWLGSKMARYGEPATFLLGHTLLAQKTKQTSGIFSNWFSF